MLEQQSAADIASLLSGLANPNLQIVIATTPHSVLANLVAERTIRLSRTDSNILPLPLPADFHIEQSTARPLNIVTIQNAIGSYKEGLEDLFIDHVVRPGLLAMRYEGVRRITTHGPGEFGVDIGPLSVPGPLGLQLLIGIQVKAGNLHSRAGKAGGSVEALIDEIRKALDHTSWDTRTRIRSRLDFMAAIISGHLTSEARHRFFEAFEHNRRVLLIESQELAELCWRSGFFPPAVS